MPVPSFLTPFLLQNLHYRLDSPFSLRSFSRHSRKNATPSYLSSPSTSFTVHTFHSFTLILRVSPTRISSIIKLHTQPLFHQFVTIPLSLPPPSSKTNSSCGNSENGSWSIVSSNKRRVYVSPETLARIARRAFLSSSFMEERGKEGAGKLHVDVHPATIIPLSACKLWGRSTNSTHTPSPLLSHMPGSELLFWSFA